MLATRAVAARHVQFLLAPARGGASARLGFARLEPSQLALLPEHEVLFHLQLFDGGHLGAALARILATVDCTVDWIEGDDAPQPITMPESDEPWPERIRRVRSTAPAEHIAIGPAGGFYLVMTQSQQLDLTIAEAILRRADFGYLGLLGSSTQRTQVARRMGQRGIASDSIARMTCPVGVEGISNKKPESMAIAIAAQCCNAATADRLALLHRETPCRTLFTTPLPC